MITIDGDFQMVYYRTDMPRGRPEAAQDLGRLLARLPRPTTART